MTPITTTTAAIEELETLKTSYTESYHKSVAEYLLLKNPDDIEKNRWCRAHLQGKITGINIALSILKN